MQCSRSSGIGPLDHLLAVFIERNYGLTANIVSNCPNEHIPIRTACCGSGELSKGSSETPIGIQAAHLDIGVWVGRTGTAIDVVILGMSFCKGAAQSNLGFVIVVIGIGVTIPVYCNCHCLVCSLPSGNKSAGVKIWRRSCSRLRAVNCSILSVHIRIP